MVKSRTVELQFKMIKVLIITILTYMVAFQVISSCIYRLWTTKTTV